jgi:hypothetical protein
MLAQLEANNFVTNAKVQKRRHKPFRPGAFCCRVLVGKLTTECHRLPTAALLSLTTATTEALVKAIYTATSVGNFLLACEERVTL